MGKLQWASAFVPNYKEAIRPIEALLARNQRTWTADCTVALNRLVALVFQRLQLGLADVTLPFTLHVGYTASTMQAILVQNRGGIDRPVAIIGRRLKPKEPHPEPVIAVIEATLWAVRQLQRYTAYSSVVHVVV